MASSTIADRLNKILPLVAAGIALLIVLGTAAALAAGKRPGGEYRRSDPESVAELKGGGTERSEFKEFGALRIRLIPDKGAEGSGPLLVVAPWLSYANGDSAFYEELVSKKKLFSSLIMEYFSEKTKNALLSIGEKRVKRDLLGILNGRLSLGKIEAIYFDDYIFMD